MGAWPDQQLALNFLRVVHDLWAQRPGRYVVRESFDGLVPALAQACMKALAADVRDGTSINSQQNEAVDGCLIRNNQVTKGRGTNETLNLRDVVNKVIHGKPKFVEVQASQVLLHF